MTWDNYFFTIVDAVKEKSKDTSTKIGCIIVGTNHEIISTGFNGFPIGVSEEPDRLERPMKYMFTEHAERNAIYLAARRGVSLSNSILYVTEFPCADCARAIIQSGIREVRIDSTKYRPDFDDRWKESMDVAKTMFNEAGVIVKII